MSLVQRLQQKIREQKNEANYVEGSCHFTQQPLVEKFQLKVQEKRGPVQIIGGVFFGGVLQMQLWLHGLKTADVISGVEFTRLKKLIMQQVDMDLLKENQKLMMAFFETLNAWKAAEPPITAADYNERHKDAEVIQFERAPRKKVFTDDEDPDSTPASKTKESKGPSVGGYL